jgi:hypothetical protein
MASELCQDLTAKHSPWAVLWLLPSILVLNEKAVVPERQTVETLSLPWELRNCRLRRQPWRQIRPWACPRPSCGCGHRRCLRHSEHCSCSASADRPPPQAINSDCSITTILRLLAIRISTDLGHDIPASTSKIFTEHWRCALAILLSRTRPPLDTISRR